MGVFEYFGSNAEAAAVFNAAMTTGSARSGAAIVGRYDFSGLRTIVDIGGGHGFFLATILKSNPTLRGILFDLPDVVAGADQILAGAGIRSRCEIVGGSFFEQLPAGGDAYVLRQVLHDWDDDRASAILQNCHAAVAETGKVLVVEREIAPRHGEAMPVLHVDMEMLVTAGGMERTEAQYRSLFERAGFRLTKIVPLMDVAGFSVFEGVPL